MQQRKFEHKSTLTIDSFYELTVAVCSITNIVVLCKQREKKATLKDF